MNRFFLLIILLTISVMAFSGVKNGYIDLKNYDFKNREPVDLSGEWIFRSGIPGDWNKYRNENYYSLTIDSTGAENLIFSTFCINGKFSIRLNGNLITKKDEIRALHIPIKLDFGKNTLEFKIRNYTINSGFEGRLYIGHFDTMLKKYENKILKDTLFTGASFIMFLFFIILFLSYKTDRSVLFFALLCLSLALRELVINDKIIFDYFKNLPYLLVIKLEFLTMYIIPLLIILFIKNYFKTIFCRKIYQSILVIGIIFPFITIVTPPLIFISMLYPFYIYIGLSCIYAVLILVHSKKNKIEDASRILLSILLLAVAEFLDIIVFELSERLVLTSLTIFFILLMSYTIAGREVRKEKKIKNLSRENFRVNAYLNKFVPDEFIKTVGMGDITEVERGNGIEKSMVVLFTSIKDFQQELKINRAEEIVDMLNSCYSIISPIISEYGGFIDKFIDETVMALFPGKTEDALDAVLEINKKIEIRNNKNPYEKPIILRSGLHIGSQFIGIVGDYKRVDATVISKVVNTASRINNFSGKIDREILISDDIYNSLMDTNKYKCMFMGKVKLKGKQNFIGIYSLYSELVNEADKLFSITMKSLKNDDLGNVESTLRLIQRMHPNHKPSSYYLDLIEVNKRLEVTDK